ncbi:MAG: hypothetical protein GF308_08520 [Candidatus Heimdallarchaeota archaeon]|nr:hypothetical protein [Candidatus Heimdallarchaeota archaeon]
MKLNQLEKQLNKIISKMPRRKKIQKIVGVEHDELIYSVKKHFIDSTSEGPWWKNFRYSNFRVTLPDEEGKFLQDMFRFSRSDSHKKLLKEIIPLKTNVQVWLFIGDSVTENFIIFKGPLRVMKNFLFDCIDQLGEYYLIPINFTWIICENPEGKIFVVGTYLINLLENLTNKFLWKRRILNTELEQKKI